MKINKKNLRKKLPMNLIIIIAVIIISVIVLISSFSLTGFAINSKEEIQKTAEIEVWADTSVNITNNENTIVAILLLDNKDILTGQEIEFYRDDSLIGREITDKKGYAKFSFNLIEFNLGTYSLTAKFQGSLSDYLNPSQIEKEIKIFEENGRRIILFKGENYNITKKIKNETAKIISLEGFSCKEFQDNILWTSSYTNSSEGSTNYQTWHPVHNCTELNASNCFLENVSVEARFLHFGLDNEKGEGYIQISNADESICENPIQGFYSKYLAYETVLGEGKKLGQYCGNNKNQDSECGIQITDNYNLDCYGIKAYASQYSIVDAFKVNYELCKENQK